MIYDLVTRLYEHCADHDDVAVCWLLDVRTYGLAVANALHPIKEEA